MGHGSEVTTTAKVLSMQTFSFRTPHLIFFSNFLALGTFMCWIDCYSLFSKKVCANPQSALHLISILTFFYEFLNIIKFNAILMKHSVFAHSLYT